MKASRRGTARRVLLAVCCALGSLLVGGRAGAPGAASAGMTQDAAAGGAVYYVDAEKGSDRNGGRSPERAWRTLRKAGAARLAPGDSLLLAGGQTHRGTLALGKEQSGAPGGPIVIASYGEGRAIVDGGRGDGIALTDCEHVAVRNLTLVGAGRKSGSDGAGVRLLRTRGVELSDLEVSGFRLAGVYTGGDQGTRILRVRARDNGFAGIATHGEHGDVPRSRDLYIGYCVAESNPGDPQARDNHSGNGIVVGGVDGALIEYCEAFNNGWDMPREGNGPVGIWGWNCDRLVIQHCISHDNRSPGLDGGGFDLDGGATNSVLQYNLSYDNAGCGYLLCQYPGARPWRGNVVRYNVSVNDGTRNLQSGIGLCPGRGFRDALVYNNTVINPRHAVAALRAAPGVTFRNNVFVTGGECLQGDFGRARFENNLYWPVSGAGIARRGRTHFATLEEWARATGQEEVDDKLVGLLADPLLVMPGAGQKPPTDPRQLARMPFFRLRPGSPCVGAGKVIPDNGGRDLFGNPVPSDRPPSLGAHEPAARER